MDEKNNKEYFLCCQNITIDCCLPARVSVSLRCCRIGRLPVCDDHVQMNDSLSQTTP